MKDTYQGVTENGRYIGNMIDYLDWRGDLSLAERPFNEVDNLLLTSLSYVELSDILTDLGKLTVKETWEEYRRRHEEPGKPVSSWSAVLCALAQSARFQDAILYDSGIQQDDETQFAVLAIGLSDGTLYISFRGTDSSFVGWKEDFEMTWRTTVAQQLAADFLKRTVIGTQPIYRIGGHSKGGNLAVYGAMMLLPEQQDLILAIYSNDGPGIAPEVMIPEAWERISGRIVYFQPVYCLIGNIYELPVQHAIIRSAEKHVMQHDPFSWLVETDHFVRGEAHDPESVYLGEIREKWLGSIEREKREAFVNDVFEALAAGGAESFKDLGDAGMTEIAAIISSLVDYDPATKEAAENLLSIVTDRIRDSVVNEVREKKEVLSKKKDEVEAKVEEKVGHTIRKIKNTRGVRKVRKIIGK